MENTVKEIIDDLEYLFRNGEIDIEGGTDSILEKNHVKQIST
ncbi:hypothetical protein [Bacillus cereus]|nr:hypothetical protein [Bacillus cereus]